MPTKTRAPDLVAPVGQNFVPEPTGLAGSPSTAEMSAGSEPRLITVPNGWPPYDCETHGAGCPATGHEADRMRPWPAATASPAATGSPTAAGGAALAGEGVSASAETSARTGMTAEVATDEARVCGPELTPGLRAAWPGQFAQVLVEVLTGYRSPKQLVPMTTERVRAQVDMLSYAVAAGQRPRIRRVMTSQPAAGVVEMTMVVSFGSRSRALAMRFEHITARPAVPGRPARPARWLCTEIETS
jgi:Family of unknown function (DUF6459)